MTFLHTLQNKYKGANSVDKLIYINTAIFVLTVFFSVFSGLYKEQTNWLVDWFSLDSSTEVYLSKPWAIISYGFLHADFFHLLSNLIVLYFIGNLFIQYFTQKQFQTFYFLGIIFGGLLFILSYNYFPLFSDKQGQLVGASAGVSAIFVGIATHMPNYQLKLRFIGFVKLWHLAGIWVVLNFIGLNGGNAGGNFAHLGGALFGYLYTKQGTRENTGILNWLITRFQKKEKPLKTAYRSATKKKKAPVNSGPNQKQIDAILDKISKSGYDTLTKAEKEFLFKQGKR